MPMNASIAMGYKQPDFGSPVNNLANMLQLQGAQQANQLNQQKMDDYGRGVQRTNALQSILSGEYANPEARQSAMLKGGFLKEAGDYAKGNADLAKDKAATEKDQLANAHSRLTLASQILGGAKDQASYDQARATAQSHGLDVSKMPEQFDPVFVQSKFDEGVDAKTKLEQYWKQKGYDTPDANAVLQSKTSRENSAATERSAAAGRQVQREGQAITRERLDFDKTRPATPKATGPMSVTLQKELLESDDAVQTSNSVVSTLKNALKINDKAYSGYGAKARATLMSNVVGTESADATVDIDNMMTGQGLDQMKSIFGAAPTEGERKILMDMQASADKTPTQRKAIIDRAIAAAERRGKYAEAKAKSIRGGTYLTEGVPTQSPSGQSVLDEADAILNGK